jgi:hypothetical protein
MENIVLVKFSGDREYAYITDVELAVGDKVIVPLGKDNREKEVIVTNINPAEDDAKWASKKILRRV